MNNNENKNVLPAENPQVQQENESHEQREYQADTKGNDDVPSLNLDALTGNTSKAWSVAAIGQVLNLEWLDKAVDDEIVNANTIPVPKDYHVYFGSHKTFAQPWHRDKVIGPKDERIIEFCKQPQWGNQDW